MQLGFINQIAIEKSDMFIISIYLINLILGLFTNLLQNDLWEEEA